MRHTFLGKATSSPLQVHAAVVTVDITPPVGIHLHNWAYSPFATSSGLDSPLQAKCLAMRDDSGLKLGLVVLDLGWWMDGGDESYVRTRIAQASGLAPEQLVVALTHTHAGPSIARGDHDRPGGDLIAPYIDDITLRISNDLRDAFDATEPCLLEWIQGTCGLAVNRDLKLSDGRYIVGGDESVAADDTLLVGRLSTLSGRTMAVLANYAIHLTSLGGMNSLISPDLVGRCREIIEDSASTTFFFLQGASGDLAPLDQYSGHVQTAHRNGRALAFSVLGELERMTPPGTHLVYEMTVESGAPLGIHQLTPRTPNTRISASTLAVNVPTQINNPIPSDDALVTQERMLRAGRVSANVTVGHMELPVTVWCLGDAVVFAYPGEAYSQLQVTLRAEFPHIPMVFMNLSNGGHVGYLGCREAYETERYPAWQSALGPGCLELLIEACRSYLLSMSTSAG